MYAAPNLRLNQELAVMNVGTPTFMRAPGENPGMWALESAMDELAWALKLDPVELRLKNETKEHQEKGLPFSAKHFADCLKVGAEKFGWKDRKMETRALTRDGKLIGWGMAAATFPGYRVPRLSRCGYCQTVKSMSSLLQMTWVQVRIQWLR
jgi:xanthine dehydrogenase YagR molybdenum-binding subunit